MKYKLTVRPPLLAEAIPPQNERSEFCFAKLFQSLWFWLLLTSKVAPAEGGTKGQLVIQVMFYSKNPKKNNLRKRTLRKKKNT